MKALPHRSSNYAETVCCAGVGRNRKWRRLYPVQFRILDPAQKFTRWQWLSYQYTTSAKDRRIESQKVIPETIKRLEKVKKKERAAFLSPLVRNSLTDADANQESLTLIRPKLIDFSWKAKTDEELSKERIEHAKLANQYSLLDKIDTKPLNPCPYVFRLKWRDRNNKPHSHTCDDWETSTAFFRRRKSYGTDAKGLLSLKDTYEKEHMERGLVLAFSTHSRRNVTFDTPNQWLLVGMIRLDESPQGDLLLD